MAIDPSAVGAVTEPVLFEWTDRDTLLYALGVGAGLTISRSPPRTAMTSTSRCCPPTR